MNEERTLIVGYDLGYEYTQISCFGKKLIEPESVSITSDANGYFIKTAFSVKESTNEWLIGEEAKHLEVRNTGIYIDNLLKKLEKNENTMIDGNLVSSDSLIEKFFAKTLSVLRQKYSNHSILQLVVTTRYLTNELKIKLYAILKKLGLNNDRVQIISYTECFMYYAISQKSELWTNDVGLFDLNKDGLKFYQLSISRRGKPYAVVANFTDLSDVFPYSLMQKEKKSRLSHYFGDITNKLLFRRLITTLYFTGEGFEGDWSDEVLRNLCVGRRVFKGLNLYTKGAAYGARAICEGGFESFYFLNEDRIMSTISMKVYKDAREGNVIFAKAGDYWDSVYEEVRIFLDNENTLDFTINNLIKKDVLHSFLTLTGLPKRENKTIQLSVSLRFADRETAVIKVKDLGFGVFYKSTYQIWEFRLMI